MRKILLQNHPNKVIRLFNFSPTQIIALGFAFMALLGGILLSLPVASRSGMSAGFTNSLFTATSAICVTGLVVVDTHSHWSEFGQAVIIFLIQIGGLGFMSMATLFSLIIGRRVSLKERLTIQESLNEFTLSGMVRTLKNILLATLFIELIGALLLSTRLIPIYGIRDGIIRSVFHSISAFCNAGFDIFGNPGSEFVSLVPFRNDPLIILVISFLFIVGGLGFLVWREVWFTRRFSHLMLHTQVVLLATILLIFIGTLLLFLFEYNNAATIRDLPFWSKLLNAYFHAVSPRTAGFNTLQVADMTESSKFVTILLMFIGAASGSTGGGIKVTTFSILVFGVLSSIKGQDDVNILRKRVSDTVFRKSISIITLSLILVVITTLILLINNEGSFMQVLFEATSAFGTVGLSTGITPNLNTISKYAIIATMYLGRVGPLSAAIALSLLQSTGKLPYRYPEGRITVG